MVGKGATESGGFEWLVKLCGLLMDYLILFAYLGIIGYNLLIS